MQSPRTNASTCLPGIGVTMGPPPPLRAVYDVARAVERSRGPAPPGYRLYWMAAGRFGTCDVPCEGFVVVGRHSLCDAVLDGDPAVALRHLIVRASLLDDGCPRLSVQDLHTNLGFSLADGHGATSITATGVLGLHVGAFGIVALPGGERAPEALPAPRVLPAGAGHPYREAGAATSSIVMLRRASWVGESAAPLGAARALVLSSARASAVVRVSPLDLELGVLVGRAPKCSGPLRAVLNDGISRVHLLLRRDVAYDLSSTQGTYVAGVRVRSARLDEATPIRLGTASPVELRVTGL